MQIPAGIDNNQSILIRNKGFFGKDLDEKNRGDLFVVICVDDHPVFKRKGHAFIN